MPTWEWWSRRRFRYTLAVLAAGVVAFACFLLGMGWGLSLLFAPARAEPGFDLTWLPISAGLLVVLLAGGNLCYLLGPLVERIVPARFVDRYRRVSFALGLVISMLVPFVLPVALGGFITVMRLVGYGSPVHESDLSGTYVADYGFATDTLTLTGDGGYVQTIRVAATGKTAVAKGHWYFDPDLGGQYVVVEEPLDALDSWGEKLNPNYAHQQPDTVAPLEARWLLGRLELGGDDIPWGRTGAEIPYTKQPTAKGDAP